MDLAKKAAIVFFTLTFMAISGVSLTNSNSSIIHKVGDRQGWTADVGVDYIRWAQSGTFHIGDIIYFEYDPGFHNVLQVSREDYHACNAANPIATYSSGNDYIKIKSHGHYFFICGFPSHCTLTSQKVDIRAPEDN
ncbi:hypothetical protein ACH5RR_020166 [Cinchona calisaya]|uniref:Phytocyanin domain-containing protein n=1 Tax=Cinchona calisaya TaxID=153742 RepID=A0ABD2ZHI1_9GENT